MHAATIVSFAVVQDLAIPSQHDQHARASSTPCRTCSTGSRAGLQGSRPELCLAAPPATNSQLLMKLYLPRSLTCHKESELSLKRGAAVKDSLHNTFPARPSTQLQGSAVPQADFRNLPRRATATWGLVASDNSRCSQIGRDVMESGGNAVDAAVATALVRDVSLGHTLWSKWGQRHRTKLW